jgi:chemotaxis response regulator CheB
MSKKILVVDDNADMREMLQIYLVSCGFTVMLAGDGNEGIEAAKTHSPDLIVTDASICFIDASVHIGGGAGLGNVYVSFDSRLDRLEPEWENILV